MGSSRKYIAPPLAAGARAAAIARALGALAAGVQSCKGVGLETVSYSPGNAQITTTPTQLQFHPCGDQTCYSTTANRFCCDADVFGASPVYDGRTRRCTTNAAPTSLPSTHSRPPCSATIIATMASPRPLPPESRARPSSSRTKRIEHSLSVSHRNSWTVIGDDERRHLHDGAIPAGGRGLGIQTQLT